MKRKTCKAIAMAAAVLLVLGTAGKTWALDNWYAVTSITNGTNTTLTYSVRWGDNGQWQQVTLGPGGSMNHYWRYDYANENRSPALSIRFDADLTAGTYWRDYTLVRYASPYASYEGSKKYVFRYTSGTTVDLFGVN
jgi:hypothetical protein